MRKFRTLLTALASVAVGALELVVPLNATAQASGCPPTEALGNFLPSPDIGAFQTTGFAFGELHTYYLVTPNLSPSGCPV
jgi:hypothetical protein